MKKILPKVFQNKIDKKLNNNTDIYYSINKDNAIEKKENSKIINNTNINKKINDIFASSNYIYKAKVEIKMLDNVINTKIVGRNKNYLITFDNQKIPIKDIIDIKENK